MSRINVDNELLKNTIKEVLMENPSIFENALREYLLTLPLTVSQEENKINWLKEMIEEDFKQYDGVFRSLAEILGEDDELLKRLAK